VVRWAAVDDAPDIADVHVASWQKAYAGVFPETYLNGLDREARARWWRRHIGEGARVLVSESERVVGFCIFGSADDEGWGEIFAIYVHPDHWDEGHGHELLEAGEAALREQDHDRALLWVLEANERGRRFYERQGWVEGKPVRLEEIGGVQVTELRYEKGLKVPS
jgi:ribosomal protein S18 acetylase RimI-like enzyme